MKHLKLFEENRNKYYCVIIAVDGIPEIIRLFNKSDDTNNFLINTIHSFLKKYSTDNYLEELNDPLDVKELMDLAAFSEEFDNYKIYVEYVDFTENIKLDPEIQTIIDSKNYNL